MKNQTRMFTCSASASAKWASFAHAAFMSASRAITVILDAGVLLASIILFQGLVAGLGAIANLLGTLEQRPCVRQCA